MKQGLIDRIATWATILVVLMTIPVLAVIVAERYRRNAPAHPENPYKANERLDILSPTDVGDAAEAILVVFQTQCRVCTESMDFYRRLGQNLASTRGRVKLIAMSIDPLWVSVPYLKSHHVAVDKLLQYPMNVKPRMSVTPTLIVVGHDLHIRAIFEGRLSKEEEAQVEGMLKG
jgi:hypothetical protein